MIRSDIAKWATNIPMIVVGAVDSTGYPWSGTQFDPADGFPSSGVHVWAPGVSMTFASGVDPDKEYIKTDGTSGGKLPEILKTLCEIAS